MEEDELSTGKGEIRSQEAECPHRHSLCKFREDKKKRPDAFVNFSEFSKKWSGKWKTTSTREKGETEDMANADKPCCEREVKTYIPHKVEDQREVQGPQRTQEAASAFLVCAECGPQLKGDSPGLSIGGAAETGSRVEQHCCRRQAAL